jgi:hypothetical protein
MSRSIGRRFCLEIDRSRPYLPRELLYQTRRSRTVAARAQEHRILQVSPRQAHLTSRELLPVTVPIALLLDTSSRRLRVPQQMVLPQIPGKEKTVPSCIRLFDRNTIPCFITNISLRSARHHNNTRVL